MKKLACCMIASTLIITLLSAIFSVRYSLSIFLYPPIAGDPPDPTEVTTDLILSLAFFALFVFSWLGLSACFGWMKSNGFLKIFCVYSVLFVFLPTLLMFLGIGENVLVKMLIVPVLFSFMWVETIVTVSADTVIMCGCAYLFIGLNFGCYFLFRALSGKKRPKETACSNGADHLCGMVDER